MMRQIDSASAKGTASDIIPPSYASGCAAGAIPWRLRCFMSRSSVPASEAGRGRQRQTGEGQAVNRPIAPTWLSRLPERAAGASEGLPSLLRMLRILRRRSGILIATTLLLMAIAVIVVMNMTPLYTSEAMLVMETQQGQTVDVGAMVSGLPADVASIETELEVLRSWGFARTVIASLQLQYDSELNPAIDPPSAWSELRQVGFARLEAMVTELTGWSLAGDVDPGQSIVTDASGISTDIVEAFLGRRQVSSLGNSRALSIAYTSSDPVMAAKVAQAMAELYIVERLESRFDATRRVSDWLNQRVGQLRAEVAIREQAVADYRSQHDLVSGERGVALVDEEISQLNAQLIEAQAARFEAEVALSQIQFLAAQDNAATAAAVLDAPLIQGLRQEEARLQALVSEYATRYSDEHPTMRDARAQLGEISAAIDREIQNIAQGLANAASVARSQEAALRGRLQELKGRIGTSSLAEVEMRSLELDAQSARDLLEVFLQQFNASTAQEDIIAQQPGARIVSAADIPEDPSFPATKPILALALLSAIVAGVALSLLRELLDNSFRSSSELESESGMRVLGHIPYISGRRRRRRGLAEVVSDTPHSIETEAVRRICMAISLGCKNGLGNRYLFASAQPAEGKTSLATAVARMNAASGRRVLLVDADTHRPSVHARLDLKRQPGLREVLMDDLPLEEAVQRDGKSGAWVLVAGKSNARDTFGMFASDRLTAFFEQAGRDYDLVIVDSPPISAVSEALALSQFATTIFVVRWGGAPQAYVLSALRELVDMGGRVLGLVLAQVNIADQLKYGASDSGGYMPDVRKYYAKS